MKIKIKDVINNGLSIIVNFSTEFGEGKAFWEGDVPIQNCEYYTEVDIHDNLVWGKNIIRTNENLYSFNLKNEIINISGILESTDVDGYSILRVGDYIIPFMATGTPFIINTFIILSIELISLSPVFY